MLTINTNLSSLIVQSNLLNSTLGLNQAIERMTTGFKINHAKDNAAGYSISTNMSTKIGAFQVAEDNTLMGLDILNTASENLNFVASHLQRIRDLAEQASNGTYGLDSLEVIQKEIDARAAEISRVMYTTEYNGIQLYGDGTPISTGDFIDVVKPLTEEEAIAQGYTVVKTADDLQAIQGNPGKYILMNDIDLAGYDWEPIINNKRTDLNGNGYVIKNLTVNNPKDEMVGLFSGLVGGISNLGLENVNVTGKNFVGGLVGRIISGEVTNCYVTGNVSGSSYVGGLIGHNLPACGAIRSYSKANVTGTARIGGLVGSDGYARNCFSTGKVKGDSYVGGLAGTTVQMSSCYSSGLVVGNTYTGGICGGGMGYPAPSTNVYWNIETSGQSQGSSVTQNIAQGVTTKELNELITNGTLVSIAPESLKGGSVFDLQVGIDSSINSVISFDTTFSFELNLNVLTNAASRNTLTQIDNILAQISAKQTEFGAAQNRLESALEQISVQYENLVSSRSTIRDADIAEESSEYIKMQILQQASATLLATANQTPALALRLLGGSG